MRPSYVDGHKLLAARAAYTTVCSRSVCSPTPNYLEGGAFHQLRFLLYFISRKRIYLGLITAESLTTYGRKAVIIIIPAGLWEIQ